MALGHSIPGLPRGTRVRNSTTPPLAVRRQMRTGWERNRCLASSRGRRLRPHRRLGRRAMSHGLSRDAFRWGAVARVAVLATASLTVAATLTEANAAPSRVHPDAY